MKTFTFAMIALITIQISACAGRQKGKPAPIGENLQASQDKEWTFEPTPMWADEFDKAGQPDTTKWGYDIGGSGWGNNELQYYTSKAANASVANGILTITVKKEAIEGKEYTAARLTSKGKGDFLYGRIEARAKLPGGKGTWPAIWMLPTDRAYGTWPKSGEIDIMEHVGHNPNKVHISTHTEAYNHVINTQKTAIKMVDSAMTQFHLYRVDWTPNAIRGYIDNMLVFTLVNEGTGYAAWPFDKRFHILLNVAFGGNWGGEKGIDPSVLPAKMEIDYVRVYKMIRK